MESVFSEINHKQLHSPKLVKRAVGFPTTGSVDKLK